MGSRTFIQKLGLYCLGIAVGLMALGYFQAKRGQAAAQQAAATGTGADVASGAGAWTPERVERTKADGLAIAAALEVFRSEHGQYPDALSRLVPSHLPAVASPAAGDAEWRYRVAMDGSFFFLSFGEDLGETFDGPNTAHLDSRTREWQVIGAAEGDGAEPVRDGR